MPLSQATLPPCGRCCRLVPVSVRRAVWRCVPSGCGKCHQMWPWHRARPDICGRVHLTGSLLDDLVIAEDARADEGMAGETIESLSALADMNAPGWRVRRACHALSANHSLPGRRLNAVFLPVGVARRRHHTGLIATKAAGCCCIACLEGWCTKRAHRVPDSSACGCVRALYARG